MKYLGHELPANAAPEELKQIRSLLWRINERSTFGDSQAVNQYSKSLHILEKHIENRTKA